MPPPIAARSFSSRTRLVGMAAASLSSSNCQVRFVVVTRPPTTGPAMPKHAASMWTRGPSARKLAIAASNVGNSRLQSVPCRATWARLRAARRARGASSSLLRLRRGASSGVPPV